MLTGPRATKAAVQAAIEDAIGAVDADGTVMFVYEGHGIGGDYGDARLLSFDDTPEDMSSTGMDVERIPSRLGAVGTGRKMVVLTDAVHRGAVSGLALIGPQASDWLPGSSFAVVSSTGPDQVSTPGMFQSVLIAGLQGGADANQDGSVTMGELEAHLNGQLEQSSGGSMAPIRAGGLDNGHVVAVGAKVPASVAVEIP